MYLLYLRRFSFLYGFLVHFAPFSPYSLERLARLHADSITHSLSYSLSVALMLHDVILFCILFVLFLGFCFIYCNIVSVFILLFDSGTHTWCFSLFLLLLVFLLLCYVVAQWYVYPYDDGLINECHACNIHRHHFSSIIHIFFDPIFYFPLVQTKNTMCVMCIVFREGASNILRVSYKYVV